MSERVKESVVVPVKGSETGDKGLLLAKKVFPNLNIIPLHVIVVKRSFPLDAEMVSEAERGEKILDRAEKLLGHDSEKDQSG